MKSILVLSSLFFIVQIQQSAFSQCGQLIWSDEFNGNALDESKWSYQRGSWNGSQVQNCYVDDNTSVSNGTLKITSRYEPGYDCFNGDRDFTSGFVQTRNRISWTYGVFKARVKLPRSNSTWPAFWMSPQDPIYGEWPQSGEIDIFEVRGHDLSSSAGNAHWGNSRSDRRQDKGTYNFPNGNDASNWHVYEVEWNEGELKFYIDGNHYHTIDDFREPNATTHPGPFNIDFFLRLNVAVGGTFLNEPWNDANNAIDQLPATMEVDWVRVYEQQCPETSDMPLCELISNGDFENGTTDWTVFKSGADGNIQVEPNGFLRIDVIDPGSSDWRLSLRQTDVSLQQGKTYTIRFDAYADASRSASIIMSKIGGSQYAYLSLDLTDNLTSYSLNFTMNDPDDDQAIFNLNVGASAIDVFIDNISISEDDCVPPCENPNTLTNSSFEDDFIDWNNRKGGTAQANFDVVNNSEIDGMKAARVQVLSAGQNPWDVQIKRNGIEFEQGEMYEISFAIKANQNNLQFSYGFNEENTNSNIVNGNGIVNTSWQTVRKTFTPDAYGAFLFINLSHDEGVYFVDNVQLNKVCESDVPDPPNCNLLVTNLNDIGPGSLKEAIACAEDGAIITIVDVLSDFNIFIQDVLITIDKNLTIESNADSPTFLNATNVQRIFEVANGVTLTINNINLVGGQANTSNAILNNGTVRLNDVEVFTCLINPNPDFPRLGGNGVYELNENVVIHK